MVRVDGDYGCKNFDCAVKGPRCDEKCLGFQLAGFLLHDKRLMCEYMGSEQVIHEAGVTEEEDGDWGRWIQMIR